MRGKSRKVATVVEGASSHPTIANCFANHYNILFNSVDYCNNEMKILFDNVCNNVLLKCNYDHSNHNTMT